MVRIGTLPAVLRGQEALVGSAISTSADPFVMGPIGTLLLAHQRTIRRIVAFCASRGGTARACLLGTRTPDRRHVLLGARFACGLLVLLCLGLMPTDVFGQHVQCTGNTIGGTTYTDCIERQRPAVDTSIYRAPPRPPQETPSDAFQRAFAQASNSASIRLSQELFCRITHISVSVILEARGLKRGRLPCAALASPVLTSVLARTLTRSRPRRPLTETELDYAWSLA